MITSPLFPGDVPRKMTAEGKLLILDSKIIDMKQGIPSNNDTQRLILQRFG
jgi:hypothetical protein